MSWRRTALDALGWRTLCRLGSGGARPARDRSCLVVSPHPDDETLGCGATILRKRDHGAPVWVVFASDGRYSHRSARISPAELGARRERESREACRRLGVGREAVYHLGLEEGGLDEERPELCRRLAEVLAEARPDEVLVTSGLDWHPDHRAVNRAVLDLVDRELLEARVFEYAIWYWLGPWTASWGWRALGSLAGRRWRTGPLERRPLPGLVPTRGYLEWKLRALRAHESQTIRLGGDPTWTTLGDVEGGRFVAAFFREYEVFFELRRVTPGDGPPSGEALGAASLAALLGRPERSAAPRPPGGIGSHP